MRGFRLLSLVNISATASERSAEYAKVPLLNFLSGSHAWGEYGNSKET